MVEYIGSFLRSGEAKMKSDAQLSTMLQNELDDDRKAIAHHAFERYFESRSLMGTMETCLNLVGDLEETGVNELACLVDFGLDNNLILEGLHQLKLLRRKVRK